MNVYTTLYLKKHFYSTLGRSKFEFEQELPSLYRTAIFCTVRRPNQTNIDRGQFSWHSPVGGLTMTTPMARSEFLQYPA